LVSQINGDSRLRELVAAGLDQDGKLTITSKGFGSASAFTAISNQDASDSNSGIGTGGATMVNGLDVQGTINGEAATGNGQFLMGATGNERTEGLQIMYAGDTPGNIGQINFNQGLSNMLDGAMEPFTDIVNGVLSAADKAVQSQIEDINSRITRMNESLVLRESFLRQRFARMEEAMGRLQSQGGQISSMAAGWQANNRR
jgi:flagellar hook-associated protein 2